MTEEVMGLDQYAVLFTADEAGDRETDISWEEEEEEISGSQMRRLQVWRKHSNLQGWMEKLYREKGGEAKDFNCVTVRLNLEDIDRLEKVVIAGELPHTTGFFFGQSQPEHKAEDLEFIAKARDAIGKGFIVCYDSWW
jgi:hypothetical protein